MKSSSFFPFMVLLALGILTSWALQGPLKYAIKPGACPPKNTFNCFQEKRECNYDWQCPKNYRCCQIHCDYRCIDPLPIRSAVRTKPGKCPELKMECEMLHPFSTCEWDGECEDDYKCCQSVCGKLCFPPQQA